MNEMMPKVFDYPEARNVVVTHTAPSFCEKQNHDFLRDWADIDPELIDDVAAERKTMDLIHGYLKEKGIPVRNWFYGHFHQSWGSFIEGIRFKMLDIMEICEIRQTTDEK